MDNKYTSKLGIYFLMIWAFTIIVIFGALSGGIDNTPVYAITRSTGQPNAPQVIIGAISEGREAKTTAFSSGECHTKFCHENPERNGHQIALSSAFGKVKKVYIIELKKTYDVIGRTNQNTEADIYFGSDQKSAKEFGVHYYHLIAL